MWRSWPSARGLETAFDRWLRAHRKSPRNEWFLFRCLVIEDAARRMDKIDRGFLAGLAASSLGWRLPRWVGGFLAELDECAE